QHPLQREPAAGHGPRHLSQPLGGDERRGARDRARSRRLDQRRARHRAHEARSPAAREARHRDRADAQDQGGVRPPRHPQSGKAPVMKRLETDQLWTAIDGYISDQLVNQDAALDAALEASKAAGLPPINVAPNQGKLLMMLAEMIGARRILEIGT